MKRVWTTIVLLLLGVGTTYAFAIGIAIWRNVGAPDQTKGQFCGSGACMWQVSSSERPGVQQSIGVSPTASLGRSLSNEQIVEMFRLTELHDPPWPLDQCFSNYPRGAQGIEKRCGWPWLAVRGGVVTAPSTQSVGYDIVDNHGCFARWVPDPKTGGGELIVIPLMPMWPGFLMNLLVFVAAWAIIFAMMGAVRRRAWTLSPRAAMSIAIACVAMGVISTLVSTVSCALYVDEYARDGGEGDIRTLSYKGPHYRIWWLTRSHESGATRWVSRWISGGEEIGDPGVVNTPSAEGHMPGWATFLRPREGIDLDRTQVIADARGWPWLAFGGGYEATRADERTATPQAITRAWFAIVMERRKSGELDPYATRIIPLRPLWPGLLANLAFFTLAWLGAFVFLLGPATLRRAMRRHRGQCLTCGYDLRSIASDRCPECGATTAIAGNDPRVHGSGNARKSAGEG